MLGVCGLPGTVRLCMYNIMVLPTLYPKSERGKGFLGKGSALPECMYEKWHQYCCKLAVRRALAVISFSSLHGS